MKKIYFLSLLLIGSCMVGCTTEKNTSRAVASSSSAESSAVGKIISTEKANPDIAYKIANKNIKFYYTLEKFGKKSEEAQDYYIVKDDTFGAIKKITTETGVYYQLVDYADGARGFNHFDMPQDSKEYYHWAIAGYVKASDLKRYYPYKANWQYKNRRPYYIGDTGQYRLWNAPVETKHYTYIRRGFDRYAQQQLYATKELILRRNNHHYVFLETKNGKQLGWVYKSSKALLPGKYRDPGQQFLTVKKNQKMIKKVQSKKSTGNRAGINDSISLPQRSYVVKNKNHHVVKVLVMGMNNRPVKAYFKHGRSTQVKFYELWRTPWKTVTNQKKLRTHVIAWHEESQEAGTVVYFYSQKSKKLINVETQGADGYANTIIYKNGKTKFKTHAYKDVLTYPISAFT